MANQSLEARLYGAVLDLISIITVSMELSKACSQPSASGELEKPKHRSRMWVGGVGACYFSTATGNEMLLVTQPGCRCMGCAVAPPTVLCMLVPLEFPR